MFLQPAMEVCVKSVIWLMADVKQESDKELKSHMLTKSKSSITDGDLYYKGNGFKSPTIWQWWPHLYWEFLTNINTEKIYLWNHVS